MPKNDLPPPDVQPRPSNPTQCVEPVRLCSTNPRAGFIDDYQAPAGLITGAVQIFCGIVSILFGILALFAKTWFYTFATGIWSGMFYVIAGWFGVASRSKRSGMIVSYLVMSIVACNIAFWFAFGIHLGAFLNEFYGCGYPLNHDNYYQKEYIYEDVNHSCWSENARTTIDGILMAVTVTEFIVSIIGSSFTCAGICFPTQQTYASPGTANKQQPMVYPLQQPVQENFTYAHLQDGGIPESEAK